MEATVYNNKGKAAGKIALPEAVFGLKWNADLVHQVTTSMMSSLRNPVAHAKDRSEVSGGGKKPWRQKGTGRARHGSTRSPLWRHGGKAHGPEKEKNFDRKVNKKMKAKALYTLLSAKFRDGEILFVDSLDISEAKTKSAIATLKTLATIPGFDKLVSKKNNSAYIALDKKDANVLRGLSNLSNMEVDEIRNVSPLDLLKYKYVVITNPEEGLKQIAGKLSK